MYPRSLAGTLHVSLVILLLQKTVSFAPISRGRALNFIAAESKTASLQYARNMKLIMQAKTTLYSLLSHIWLTQAITENDTNSVFAF
jgi:hypothetical protein